MKSVRKVLGGVLYALACMVLPIAAQEKPDEIMIKETKQSISLYGKSMECFGIKIMPKPAAGDDLESIIIRSFRYNPKNLEAGKYKPLWEEMGLETLAKLQDETITADFKRYSVYRLQAQRRGINEAGETVYTLLNTSDFISIERATEEECATGNANILNLKLQLTNADKARIAAKWAAIGVTVAAAAGLGYLAYRKYKGGGQTAKIIPARALTLSEIELLNDAEKAAFGNDVARASAIDDSNFRQEALNEAVRKARERVDEKITTEGIAKTTVQRIESGQPGVEPKYEKRVEPKYEKKMGE